MKLTNEQHEKIKDAVIEAVYCAANGAYEEVCAVDLLRAHIRYKEDNRIFALVNCTTQLIIETIEAPSAVPVDRHPTPQNGGHHLLAAGGAEIKK